ncbi:hypothetical protein KGQ19_01415 [Catenulispora sp. NL8]|uniref:Uncharacterized protein n=1 Tax=Catenulispora pinistramenti TaxID=2705254 RepID=A0ABS5KH12_9ACTN|nr:hypothetical protein [Catenulispora pinistramenti]MBS2545519.1 hypothetical protein [Catenulispora pinistramenti]
MSLDLIISQLRELSANATRAAKSPAPCCGGNCPHAYRAQTMAARFTELDAAMSNLARLPRVWSSPFVPAPRNSR